MLYTEYTGKRVDYDLSNVEIGESIFSSLENGDRALCVRISEDKWKVYKYQLNVDVYSSDMEDPSIYISVYNRVFDAEKTKWVSEYFRNIGQKLRDIQDFNGSIERNFI